MMNCSPPPLVSDLVLVGGGHAHVHVIKMFGMPKLRRLLTENGIRVTLIAKDIDTPYSGMLPGYISGHYTHEEIHIDLVRLCQFANVILVHAACAEIIYNSTTTGIGGGGGGVCICDDGRPPIRYDCLSVAIGSCPSTTALSLMEHPRIIPVKPISYFSNFYQSLEQRFQKSSFWENKAKHTICVVGGGAGGIEVILCLQYKLEQLLIQRQNDKKNNVDMKETNDDKDDIDLEMILVTRANSLLPEHNKRVRNTFQRILKERNISLRFSTNVIGVKDLGNGKAQFILQEEENNNVNKVVGNDTKKSNPDDLSSLPPIIFDDCLWCTSASGPSWLSTSTPFETNDRGFVKVEDTLQVLRHPGVFAAGDCCHMVNHPRPKAGVFAVRAGPPLCHNLVSYLTNQPLKVHIPQMNFLGLISTGNRSAVASYGKFIAKKGEWVWRWKDRTDRKWIGKYGVDLPDLEEMMNENSNGSSCSIFGGSNRRRKNSNTVPGSLSKKGTDVLQAFTSNPMRCGGCGAKVGSTSLSRVLSALHQRQVSRAEKYNLPPPRPIDHDDTAITILPSLEDNNNNDNNDNNGTVTTKKAAALVQTIDYFRSLYNDPYIFGKIIAVHSLSDIHAMGGAAIAQTALTLAVVPFAADDEIIESTLLQLLSGVSDILQDENVQLIGGHTCEGMELACGLSIQGYTTNPNQLLRKRGGLIGDKIIITKPIGTGALFAASMRAKCKGTHIIEAIDSMQISNYHTSRCIDTIQKQQEEEEKNTTTDNTSSPSIIHACTDVTGFGLIGHLLEMLMANDDEYESSSSNNQVQQQQQQQQQQQLPSIGAKLDIKNIPFLRGGLEASSQHIYSSLQPQNNRNRRAVSNHIEAAKAYPIKYPLLFDPQTAGGLLMFVNSNDSDTVLSTLKENNIPATIIGEVVPYPTTATAATTTATTTATGSTTDKTTINDNDNNKKEATTSNNNNNNSSSSSGGGGGGGEVVCSLQGGNQRTAKRITIQL